ncbi:MAG TPA: PASTA domain-containing protein [Streptosporangiaceae bacterium]
MDTALSPPVGQLLGGRYHVDSRIARGGMATVYLGTDTRLDRVIALKIAHPELSDDAEFVRRFIGEARSAARLSSPNVVAIFDQGSDKRLHYIAMEYVPGRTLRQLLNERGRLSAREALDIMAGVLTGLAAAHDAGFAHRDVKPENVLLAASGAVKVADFGLARSVAGTVQTKGGMIIGTAAYLAPEQVAGGTSDARTDVYAAGIMLFELLTGFQPHTAESPLAVAYKHVDEVVPPPSSVLPGLSGAVDAMVAMATSRDPDLRPASAGQFLRAIQEVRDAQAAGTAPPQAPVGYEQAAFDRSADRAAQPHRAPPAFSGPQPRPPAFRGSGPQPGLAAFHGSEPHPSLPLHSGSEPLWAPASDSASHPYQAPGPGAGSGAHGSPVRSGAYGFDDSEDFGGAIADHAYDPGDYQTPRHWESSQPGDATPGAVGASALPSLRPQRSEVLPAPYGDTQSMANHTLVVAAADEIAAYGDLPGVSYGQPLDGGRYRGRGRRAPGGRLMYVSGALALILVIALVTWWFSSGRYQQVPALRGMTLSAAKTALKNQGLTYKLARPRTNPLPKGDVVKVSPGRGQRIAGGSSVTLTVSLGPVMRVVPDVSGQTEAAAKAFLSQHRLTVGPDQPAVSSSVPAGAVIGTIPRAYTRIPQNHPVSLIVSEGPGLPNFVGMQVTDAQAAASAGGYQINAVPNAKGSEPANTITSQSPPPDTPITPNEVVTVHFSPGPPTVPVPNVQGMPVAQAISTLQGAGFHVKVDHSGPGGTVGSYTPQGDQPKGTVITLTIGIFSGL